MDLVVFVVVVAFFVDWTWAGLLYGALRNSFSVSFEVRLDRREVADFQWLVGVPRMLVGYIHQHVVIHT